MAITSLRVITMKIKQISLLFLAFALGTNLIANERLGMFVDIKRFFDAAKNTTFVIDYQVPYKNLMFLSRDNAYFAELKVNITIANADSVLITKEFVNDIGVTRKYDLSSSNKSYLDRIALTLAQSGFFLTIEFEDLNTNKSYVWSYVNQQLDPTDRLSDLELLTDVTKETESFSQKFKRGNEIHKPEMSGLVSRNIQDSVYFYCEAYDVAKDSTKAVLTIRKDDLVHMISSQNLNQTGSVIPILVPVNIKNLEPGKYSITMDLVEDDKVFVRASEFIITEQMEELYFLFTDEDDEFQLIRYIASPMSAASWKTMSKDTKRRYISNFWLSLAAQINQTPEDVLKVYKQRVDYANARFSHFDKGWKSDMGRIYIRNGHPSDIDEDTTTDDTRFVRKDFQIWKYSGRSKSVYLFVDIPMNGNYKLVYASNDEQESTYPNWRRYLGNDFDDKRLDN